MARFDWCHCLLITSHLGVARDFHGAIFEFFNCSSYLRLLPVVRFCPYESRTTRSSDYLPSNFYKANTKEYVINSRIRVGFDFEFAINNVVKGIIRFIIHISSFCSEKHSQHTIGQKRNWHWFFVRSVSLSA